MKKTTILALAMLAWAIQVNAAEVLRRNSTLAPRRPVERRTTIVHPPVSHVNFPSPPIHVPPRPVLPPPWAWHTVPDTTFVNGTNKIIGWHKALR
jgi:hypothetical protein